LHKKQPQSVTKLAFFTLMSLDLQKHTEHLYLLSSCLEGIDGRGVGVYQGGLKVVSMWFGIQLVDWAHSDRLGL